MKKRRDMFDPYRLLNEKELPTMGAETAIKQIKELADAALPQMSRDYHQQRYKAISILAGIAAEGLGEKRGGEE